MHTLRSKLGNHLFKLAARVYDGNNPFLKSWGNKLFKLAAKVSPNKK